MNPLVSIGVITYNSRLYIRDTLQSLIKQTYKHIEILISDDASTDGTNEICQQFAKKDSRIHAWVQPKNIGIANNYNAVLSKAKGALFIWNAGDDIRNPKCVQELVSLFQKNPSCVLAVSAMHQFSEVDHHYEYLPFSQYTKSFDASRVFLLHPEYGPVMSFGMYKTRLLLSLGGYHKDIRPIFGGASEFITVYKMLLRGDLGYINKPLFLKRDTGYFLSIYRRLQSRDNLLLLASRIGRYLTFPVFMFLMDLMQSLRYTYTAPLSQKQSLILYYYCTRRFMKDHGRYVSTLMRGTHSLLLGMLGKKLSS